MRKSLLIGGAVVILGAAAAGGWQWANARARAEIESVFSGLRSAGMEASYAAIDVDLWSRGVRVSGITLKNPSAAGLDIKIDRANAEGVDIWGGARASKRVEFSNVETAFSFGGANARYSYKAPTIVLNELVIPDPAMAGASRQPGERMAMVLAGLRAGSIVVPELLGSTEVKAGTPASRGRPPVPTRIDFKYTGFRIDGVADGRLSSWSAERGLMTGGAGSPFVEATFDAMKSTAIDMMPFLGAGLGARSPVGGLYEVQSRFEMGAMRMRLVDGSSFTIAGVTGGAMRIDPERMSFAKMQDFVRKLEALGGQPASPAQAAGVGEAVAQLYEGMTFSDIEIKGMEFAGPKAGQQTVGFKVGSIRLRNLERGKLGELRFTELSGGIPDARGQFAPFNMASFALHDFDLPGMMRVSAAQQPSAPGSPEQSLRMLALLKGFEMTGFVGTDPTTRKALRIDNLLATWSQFINDIPTKVRFAYKGETAINPRDANFAPLAQLGFQSLAMDLDLVAAYDETRRTIEIGPMSVKADRLGTASLKGIIGNAGREAFSLQPGVFAAAMQRFTLGTHELKVTDSGAVTLFQSAAALGATADKPAPDLAAKLRELKSDPAFPAGNIATLVEVAAQFLEKPRQALTVRATPTRGVPLDLLLAPGPGGLDRNALAGMIDRFKLETTVTPAP